MYSIKRFEKCRGMDGNSYSADIYRDGHRVGCLMNDGWGGGTIFHWINKDEAQIADDFVKTLSKDINEFDYDVNLDCYFAKLIDRMESAKRFDRISKKSTLFHINGTTYEQWNTLTKPYVGPFKDGIRKYLDEKYGVGNYEIYEKGCFFKEKEMV